MKKVKNKRIIVPVVILLALLLGYFMTRQHINRLFDNRERAVIYRHGLLIEEKIQAVARQDGSYPSEEKVKLLIQTSNFISPHTRKVYEFIGGISDISQVNDSQMAYGIGEFENRSIENNKAYFCIGFGLPRTSEGGASCVNLSLENRTESRIKYELSCKINWLGFTTGCDKSILQGL